MLVESCYKVKRSPQTSSSSVKTRVVPPTPSTPNQHSSGDDDQPAPSLSRRPSAKSQKSSRGYEQAPKPYHPFDDSFGDSYAAPSDDPHDGSDHEQSLLPTRSDSPTSIGPPRSKSRSGSIAGKKAPPPPAPASPSPRSNPSATHARAFSQR